MTKDILEATRKFLLYTTVLLFPVFVIPVSANPFVTPRLAFVSFFVSAIMLVKCLEIIRSGKVVYHKSRFDIPVALFALAYLLSTIFRTPNKMEAFLLPGTTTAVVSACLLFFLVNQEGNKAKNTIRKLLIVGGLLNSILVWLSVSGVLATIEVLPAFIKAPNFSPEGGYIPSIIIVICLIPLALGLLGKGKAIEEKVLGAIAIVAFAVTTSIMAYYILPGKPLHPKFPSLSVDWNVAVDSLKENPLLGMGPGNYLTAFNRFRPLSYNLTDLWSVRFFNARSYYLTVLTEAGILGITALLLILWNLARQAKGLTKSYEHQTNLETITSFASVVLFAVALVFFPATTSVLILLFITLSLSTEGKSTQLVLRTQAEDGAPSSSRIPALFVTAPLIVVIAIFFYYAGRIYFAEYLFQGAIRAFVTNDGQKTYELMQRAINTNPKVDRYHAAFARIHLVAANSLVRKVTSTDQGQSGQISEEDRQNISNLVQSAINEGKAAVGLNPNRSGNWELLGNTYQSIAPLANGAEDFAIQALGQAIALDPLNTNLRVSLGGMYFSKGDYDSATRIFELAVATKPDHANARYNLALGFREKGDLERAIQQMTIVLSLVSSDSRDYEVARKTLEEMETKKKELTPALSGEELTPPQEPEQVLEPQLELSEGSEPPTTDGDSSPSPTAEPQQSPTP